MPLPAEQTSPWPPDDWREVYAAYEEWAAWYSGQPAQLAAYYGGTVTLTERAPWWKFWNRAGRVTVEHQARSQLHMPLAGDMAATSAALLFGEAPTITIAEAHERQDNAAAIAAEARLQEILEAGNIEGRLTEAADTCAAMGGVLLKVDWDTEVLNAPMLTVVQADTALPEFRYGRLVACTLWRLIGTASGDSDGITYWRHLERHETAPDGRGLILHGLYRGTEDSLGARVELEDQPETAGLQDEVRLPFSGLAVRYIPNMQPNRRFRGSALGQSDYSGAEGLMDALDETWTSWMRDIRLGKARLIVPDDYLTRNAQGQFGFDVDQEVWSPLDIAPGAEKGITENQFDIRVEEHSATVMALIEQVVSHAGYSPQTFGLHIEGRAESGTALRVRERRTLQTQQRKRRNWETPLADLCQAMLAIDREIFRSQITVFRPTVKLADSLTPDEQETATTIELLNRASAISLEIKVRMAHPEWTQKEIDAEVERLKAEQGLAIEDPIQVGVA